MADMIEIKHLNKYFGDLHVLKDINLTVKRGEKLVMIGPSGSGKSTLIRCVDYLEEPTSGEVVIDGTPLTKKNHLEMARKYSSMVFQQFNLFPQYTALENVTLAERLLAQETSEFKKDKKAILTRIDEHGKELLDRMGLAERMNHYPHQLSGGQQQRCAIARALVKNPKLLLCDEPTGALDSKTSRDILVLLEEINAKYGTTMLIVTHNNSIKNMVHKVIFIKDGLISKEYENEVRVPASELEDL